MRFAEPFKLAGDLSPEEKLEAERHMFMELTQGARLSLSEYPDPKLFPSLLVGQFN
jgi:hypothetical protein